MLELTDVRKAYPAPDGTSQAVLDVEQLSLARGEEVALAGASGSGKTTLLNVIAGILKPDAGSVRIQGTELTRLGEAERDHFRACHIGYVFQSFHLLDGYTALENVLLGMMFGAGSEPDYAQHLLERLDLKERLDYRPSQLSVGQRQRVALARALANRPDLVLADEPTGNLDPGSARTALALLRETCTEIGAGLLLVSHDADVLSVFERSLDLSDLNRAAGATRS